KQVFSSSCTLTFRSEDKYFASSEGSSIQQLNLQALGELGATAVDISQGLTKSRRYSPPQVTAGYEYVPLMNLVENARRIRSEVIEHLNAPAVAGQEGSGPSSEPSVADYPREHRPLHRARPRPGLRSQLRRNQFSHTGQDGQ